MPLEKSTVCFEKSVTDCASYYACSAVDSIGRQNHCVFRLSVHVPAVCVRFSCEVV